MGLWPGPPGTQVYVPFGNCMQVEKGMTANAAFLVKMVNILGKRLTATVCLWVADMEFPEWLWICFWMCHRHLPQHSSCPWLREPINAENDSLRFISCGKHCEKITVDGTFLLAALWTLTTIVWNSGLRMVLSPCCMQLRAAPYTWPLMNNVPGKKS